MQSLFLDLIIWQLCSGIVATVFGATGFLGRYVVSQLGKLSVGIVVYLWLRVFFLFFLPSKTFSEEYLIQPFSKFNLSKLDTKNIILFPNLIGFYDFTCGSIP